MKELSIILLTQLTEHTWPRQSIQFQLSALNFNFLDSNISTLAYERGEIFACVLLQR